MEGLFSWKVCGACVIWEKGDIDWKEDKKGFWIISFFSKLDMVGKVVLGMKCVCDIREKKKEYGSRTYFYHCSGKLVMDFHGSLLTFLFYLEYERNIRKVVHTRTI